MKTPNDFAMAAETLGLTRWQMHDCSICGYKCGYIFDGARVFYDNGCNCISYYNPPRESSWTEVADHYNLQVSPCVIEEYDRFWGFSPVPSNDELLNFPSLIKGASR